MTENNTYQTINKPTVNWSLFLIPVTIPIFLFFLLIKELVSGHDITFDPGSALGLLVISMIYGAIFWIPSIILCLIAESILIKRSSTKKSVVQAFIVEFVLCLTGIIIFFRFVEFGDEFTFTLALSMSTTQLLRWWYLNHKSRMYTGKAEDPEKNNTDIKL